MTITFPPKPDEILCIVDDKKAEEVLLQLGIIDMFDQKQHPPRPNTNTNSVLMEGPTHWVFASLFFGRDDGDNGYFVIFLPKKGHTKDEFIKFVTDSMDYCDCRWANTEVENIFTDPITN